MMGWLFIHAPSMKVTVKVFGGCFLHAYTWDVESASVRALSGGGDLGFSFFFFLFSFFFFLFSFFVIAYVDVQSWKGKV
jgi:hypothetical protein